MLHRNPLEAGLADVDAHVSAPVSQTLFVPLPDGRRQHVDRGDLERLDLASCALGSRNARYKGHIRRAFHAAEQLDEALDSRHRDIASRRAERFEKRDEDSPRSTRGWTDALVQSHRHLPTRLHLVFEC
jgi:hypothetical protein